MIASATVDTREIRSISTARWCADFACSIALSDKQSALRKADVTTACNSRPLSYLEAARFTTSATFVFHLRQDFDSLCADTYYVLILSKAPFLCSRHTYTLKIYV